MVVRWSCLVSLVVLLASAEAEPKTRARGHLYTLQVSRANAVSCTGGRIEHTKGEVTLSLDGATATLRVKLETSGHSINRVSPKNSMGSFSHRLARRYQGQVKARGGDLTLRFRRSKKPPRPAFSLRCSFEITSLRRLRAHQSGQRAAAPLHDPRRKLRTVVCRHSDAKLGRPLSDALHAGLLRLGEGRGVTLVSSCRNAKVSTAYYAR